MSEVPPKKLKQTEFLTSFQESPKKETATDSEPGEKSEACDNVQTKMDYSFKKEVEEGPSEHLQQETEAKDHTFKFSLYDEKVSYKVSCKTSMTVLEALNESPKFTIEKKKKKNMQREILIKRSKGFPEAAVKTDFPSCLIARDENLEIDFIQKDKNISASQTTADPSLLIKRNKPETLVAIWVKKEGGPKVNLLLKSKALRSKVQYVCVYALKGEIIKKALKRDGRFKKEIVHKHFALSENGKDMHEWSNLVDDLDGKAFQLVVLSDQIQPDSQEDFTFVKTEPNVASDADVAETSSSSQNPINTEQEKTPDRNTKSTNPSTKQYVYKPIVNSEEILGILRHQFPDLLDTLKKREKLKNKSEVQEYFRAEYGKSVENFLKVKKVKQLMTLSDSVCQIREGDSALGTGFLLFDRFILTNAHVIGLSTDVTKVNAEQFTAVFDYEDRDSEKRIQIKQLTDCGYGKDDRGRHLDYALLELDDSVEIYFRKYHHLLYSVSSNLPTNRHQICIVGHPGEGVKKMDPCITIGTESRLDAAEKHKTENAEYIHVMTQKCVEDKWDFHKNQITYNSCFFHGSSGSPVFDADCNLIGIHTGGYVYGGHGKTTKSVMEYAYSIQPILNMIRAHAKIKGLKDLVQILEPYTDQCNDSETPMEQN